jgi:hypothetical protein
MSEVKHAREPWSLGAIEKQAQGGKMQYLNSEDHTGLGKVWVTTDGKDSPRNKANVERIVACVNACEGVSPEDLRGLSVKGLLDGYSQDDKVKKELEEQLASICQENKDLSATARECLKARYTAENDLRELVHKLRTAIRWARLSDNEGVNVRVLEGMLDGALSNGD